MSRNYKFYNRDRLKKDWFSGRKIIYTAAQPIMQVKKEFWKMLLLLSSAKRCNRAGAGEKVGGLTFDEFLGAVFGHEIEHTTDENAKLSATGGDSEKPAHEVSKNIIVETKENKKEDEKK